MVGIFQGANQMWSLISWGLNSNQREKKVLFTQFLVLISIVIHYTVDKYKVLWEWIKGEPDLGSTRNRKLYWSVSATYCCITNQPKVSGLTTIYHCPQVCRSTERSCGSGPGSDLSQASSWVCGPGWLVWNGLSYDPPGGQTRVIHMAMVGFQDSKQKPARLRLRTGTTFLLQDSID